jgi:hypothetical protein
MGLCAYTGTESTIEILATSDIRNSLLDVDVGQMTQQGKRINGTITKSSIGFTKRVPSKYTRWLL